MCKPGPLAATPVADDEILARFVFTKRHIDRKGANLRAKPEAFAPYRHTDMSVTRHRDISEDEVWDLGRAVGQARDLELLGRADFIARSARAESLEIEPEEPPKNHANVSGWPAEKPAQMIRALVLAAEAEYFVVP